MIFLEPTVQPYWHRGSRAGKRRPSNFELLGHSFIPTYQKGVKGKYQLVVKQNSWKSLKRKLKQITKKTRPYSFEERLKKLAEIWRGWVNNYRPRESGQALPVSQQS